VSGIEGWKGRARVGSEGGREARPRLSSSLSLSLLPEGGEDFESPLADEGTAPRLQEEEKKRRRRQREGGKDTP